MLLLGTVRPYVPQNHPTHQVRHFRITNRNRNSNPFTILDAVTVRTMTVKQLSGIKTLAVKPIHGTGSSVTSVTSGMGKAWPGVIIG